MQLQAKCLFVPDSLSEMKTLVSQWRELKITDVYLLSEYLKQNHVISAVDHYNGNVWAIIQVFLQHDGETLPLAITDRGNDAVGVGDSEWLRMLCPRGVDNLGRSLIEIRKAEIRDILTRVPVYGISLDFLRAFLFWEGIDFERNEISEEPRSCFCDRCTTAFSEEYDISLSGSTIQEKACEILEKYQSKWHEFTSDTIAEVAGELIETAREISPEIETNLHLVPWSRNDFGGARIAHLGQSLEKLGQLFSQISPMCYAPMLNQNNSWISSVTHELSQEFAGAIIPAVQSCEMYGTAPHSVDAFRDMVQEALKAPATAVEIWPWERLTPEQLTVLRDFVS